MLDSDQTKLQQPLFLWIPAYLLYVQDALLLHTTTHGGGLSILNLPTPIIPDTDLLGIIKQLSVKVTPTEVESIA